MRKAIYETLLDGEKIPVTQWMMSADLTLLTNTLDSFDSKVKRENPAVFNQRRHVGEDGNVLFGKLLVTQDDNNEASESGSNYLASTLNECLNDTTLCGKTVVHFGLYMAAHFMHLKLEINKSTNPVMVCVHLIDSLRTCDDKSLKAIFNSVLEMNLTKQCNIKYQVTNTGTQNDAWSCGLQTLFSIAKEAMKAGVSAAPFGLTEDDLNKEINPRKTKFLVIKHMLKVELEKRNKQIARASCAQAAYNQMLESIPVNERNKIDELKMKLVSSNSAVKEATKLEIAAPSVFSPLLVFHKEYDLGNYNKIAGIVKESRDEMAAIERMLFQLTINSENIYCDNTKINENNQQKTSVPDQSDALLPAAARYFTPLQKGGKDILIHSDYEIKAENTTVNQLKHYISQEIGVDVTLIKLIYGGRNLDGDFPLSNANIENNNIRKIQLVILPSPLTSRKLEEPVVHPVSSSVVTATAAPASDSAKLKGNTVETNATVTITEATRGLGVLTNDELKEFRGIFPPVFPERWENGVPSELINDMLELIEHRLNSSDAVSAVLVWAEAFLQLSTEKSHNMIHERYNFARALFENMLNGKPISQNSRAQLSDFRDRIKPELAKISKFISFFRFDEEIDGILKSGRADGLIAVIEMHATQGRDLSDSNYTRTEQKNAKIQHLKIHRHLLVTYKEVVIKEFQGDAIVDALIKKLDQSIASIELKINPSSTQGFFPAPQRETSPSKPPKKESGGCSMM
ncbi:MAG: ubiquitin-like protein [Gammaproteobacteria bacterium]|nr:ubiquitin-like protein [Gammaproteobacteria bacterium]